MGLFNMNVEILEGSLTGIHHSTETSGRISTDSTGRVNGQINSIGVMNFRVNGTPVQLKMKSAISMQDKDKVVVAGKMKNGTLQACGIYNKTSGAIDCQPDTVLKVGGGLIIALSIPLLIWIVGIGTMPLGIFLFYTGMFNQKSRKMLEECRTNPTKVRSKKTNSGAKKTTTKKTETNKTTARKPAAKKSTASKTETKKPAAKKAATKKPAAKKTETKKTTTKKPAVRKKATVGSR